AAAAGYDAFDLVWQSRSGPPQVPWLEPDVGDHLTALVGRGVEAVIVCPVGFVADHIEVVWDLDNELAEQAAAAGVALARAVTPNAQRRFAELVVALMDEHRLGLEPARVACPQPVPGYGSSVNGAFCTPACEPVSAARPNTESR
ncbi:ferrochelatase, partial [Mycolicibacterium diernhoferi]